MQNNNILEVDPAIFNIRNINPGSYYAQCQRKDLITPCHNVLRQLGYYPTFEGTYKRIGMAVGTDTPWHHVKHLKTKKCGIDNNLKFVVFGYVPPRCLECWKVCVTIKTLDDLFKLLQVQKSLERASKCGIELRWYTPKLYGGYFYNNSLDEGRECYEAVRKAVDEHIGKDTHVILKRACTEYELVKGPSAGWVMTNREYEIDEDLEVLVDTYSPGVEGQNDWMLAQVHSRWVEWAFKHEDPTAGKYIGDKPLYSGCMTYHEGDISEIKSDIIRAKAIVKHDIQPEVVDSVHAVLRGFNMTKRVDFSKMGALLGFDNINPLFHGEGIEIG